MLMLKGSKKAGLGQPSNLVTYLMDDATYCLTRVDESWQGKTVVFGSEEVRNLSLIGSIADGSQSTLGYGIL